VSPSSLKDKRQFARELRQLPHLTCAFHERRIGYEAARLVARVARPDTDAEWTERAVHRTLVHLGEDLRAAGLLARVMRSERIVPPHSDVVADLKALETKVVTGAVFRDDAQSPKSVTETVAAVEAAFHAARHTPRHLRSLGRDTIRLRIEPEMRAAYRGLERLFERHRPIAMTFLRFACQALIDRFFISTTAQALASRATRKQRAPGLAGNSRRSWSHLPIAICSSVTAGLSQEPAQAPAPGVQDEPCGPDELLATASAA